jgi:hypothetical protein
VDSMRKDCDGDVCSCRSPRRIHGPRFSAVPSIGSAGVAVRCTIGPPRLPFSTLLFHRVQSFKHIVEQEINKNESDRLEGSAMQARVHGASNQVNLRNRSTTTSHEPTDHNTFNKKKHTILPSTHITTTAWLILPPQKPL